VQRNQSINGDTDALVTGLQLLAHVVADADLGERFLAMTGLAVDDLRARAAEPGVLAALIDFVAAHETDLVTAADAIGVPPAAIIAAGRALGGGAPESASPDEDWS
jgi:adenine/guanine phosphoribosyltransferase-like PRPP-binding protein